MNIGTLKPSALNRPSSAAVCTHCGDTCADQSLIFEERAFCCNGCKLVYEILDKNGLCQYYELENTPGISFKNGFENKDFAYLDSEEILSELIDFQDEKIVKITLQIPAIHCTSCLFLLENFYKLNSGVEQSKVNFLKKELQLTYSKDRTSFSRIVEMLHRIGYAPEINLGSLKKEKTAAVPKSFYLKLGVTGFVFGNVMLLSFPEYLGLQQATDNLYFKVFGYLNLALGFPLVFYSGSDYLRSAWFGLRERELNMDVPISLGILALFGRSLFEILTHTGAGYMDSLAGLLFFLLAGKWFQQKTFHNINFEKDYQSYFPIAVTVLHTDGSSEKVPVKKLKQGHRIFIKNRELIPADSILKSERAEIDYGFVTGESAPVSVKKGERIYAGGRQTGGGIEVQLVKTISQSYLIQLWNDPAFAKISNQQKIKEQALGASRLATMVGKYFTIIVLAVAFLTLFFWLPKDIGIAINAFSAVLIIACPCAIALSIPFTYGNVLRLLARKSFYLKNTTVIESLRNINHIVFDKTGTLTERGEQLVFFEMNKSGFTNSPAHVSAVQKLVAQSSHPRSHQIYDYFSKPIDAKVQSEKEKNLSGKLTEFMEFPGKGILGKVGNFSLKIGSAAFFENEDLEKGRTYIRINGQIVGYFKHHSSLRKGLHRLIEKLKPDFKLSLLSGDHSGQAERFNPLFGESQFFNQSPHDKLKFIKKLQSEGDRILMIGDGLNDAGALQEASVGVVISENNNNFTPAGDGILNADAFEELPDLIDFAKRSRRVVFGSYLIALIYNIIGLSFAVRGALSPVIAAILMPLSSITIVISGLAGSWFLWKYMIVPPTSEKTIQSKN